MRRLALGAALRLQFQAAHLRAAGALGCLAAAAPNCCAWLVADASFLWCLSPPSYWSIYGLITAAERPLDRLLQWVPYYHAVKLLLLVWLQSPAYEGAQRVYIEGIRPWLLRYQPALDGFLAALLRSLVRGAAGGGGAARLHAALVVWPQLQEHAGVIAQCTLGAPDVPACCTPPAPHLLSQRRPEVQAAAEACHHFAQQVPVLEWFVRAPGGRPTRAITDGSVQPRQ